MAFLRSFYDFTNTTKMRIGSSICGGNTIPGDLDEVRIWDIVRTSEEIMGFKDAVLPPSASGLIAYYDFDNQNAVGGGNNSGETTLEDRTANNNDGTLQNFTLDGATSNWLVGFHGSI